MVYTEFESMLTQTPKVIRLLPLAVVDPQDTPEGQLAEGDPGVGANAEEIFHEYRFEPDPVSVLMSCYRCTSPTASTTPCCNRLPRNWLAVSVL